MRDREERRFTFFLADLVFLEGLDFVVDFAFVLALTATGFAFFDFTVFAFIDFVAFRLVVVCRVEPADLGVFFASVELRTFFLAMSNLPEES